MKTQESGHAKNVANFKAMITYCESYQTSYNPGNDEISMNNLKTLLTNVSAAFEEVRIAKSVYDHVTNEREIAFKNVGQLLSKLSYALQSCGASPQKMDDARSILRKVNGGTSKKKNAPPSPDSGETKNSSHSVSHSSYDNKLATLKIMIGLMETEPNYHPNEPEMTTDGLNALYNDLLNKNQSVHEVSARLAKARTNRNNLFYLAENNLFVIASKVKNYIKSIFGLKSDQYRQLSRIKVLKLEH